MRSCHGALLLSLIAGGCLPRGPAPMGAHLDPGRDSRGVAFVPAAAASFGGVAPLVLWRGGSDVSPSSLYLVDASAANGASRLRLLLPSVDISMATNTTQTDGCRFGTCGFDVDGRGRLALPLPPSDPGSRATSDLALVDLATGAVEDVPGALSHLWSPRRTRLLYGEYREVLLTHVHEVDDDEDGSFAATGGAQFLGEDVYFVSAADATLQRLRPHGTPEVVASEVDHFVVAPMIDGPALFLCHLMADVCARLDPATGAETPLPRAAEIGTRPALSPDGRRFMVTNYADAGVTYTFIDPDSGDESTLQIPQGTTMQMEPRPGHDELWLPYAPASSDGTYSGYPDRVAIWSPRGTATLMRTPYTFYERMPEDAQSLFTRDGAYLMTVEFAAGGRPLARAVPADDPTAPGVALNPAGTATQRYWQLTDGRLLVEAYATTDQGASDVYLVDPSTGETRTLASGGHVVAVGATRVLAQLHWLGVEGSGSLTLIDLATGAETLLAENVYAVALERRDAPPQPDGDPLEPGARVAYLVKSRIASPYDGLWLASLP